MRARHELLRRLPPSRREHPVFNTFVGGFSPPGAELNPSFFDSKTTEHGETATIRNKQTRYDWGLLEGLLSDRNG